MVLYLENMTCVVFLFWNLSVIAVFNQFFSSVAKKGDKFRFIAEFQKTSRWSKGADAVRHHSRSFLSVFTVLFAMLEGPPRLDWGVPPCFA